MEVGARRKIGKPKLKWSDDIRHVTTHNGERNIERRNTIPENMESKNSLRRHKWGKGEYELVYKIIKYNIFFCGLFPIFSCLPYNSLQPTLAAVSGRRAVSLQNT